MNTFIQELAEYNVIDKEIIKSFKMRNTLCPLIFDKKNDTYIMKNDINKSLLKITDDFIESLNIDFFIHDVLLTGSLANYNWSKYSDIDLHILVDFKDANIDLDLIKDYFDAKKNVWNNNHDVTIKNFEVELYVQDVNEKHTSSGVYSVLNNKWIIQPNSNKESIDEKKILKKGDYFATIINNLIKSNQPKDTILTKIDSLREKLKKFRQAGLDAGGEYSYENLTFKLLRRNGYIQKLMNLKNILIDKKLSIK